MLVHLLVHLIAYICFIGIAIIEFQTLHIENYLETNKKSFIRSNFRKFYNIYLKLRFAFIRSIHLITRPKLGKGPAILQGTLAGEIDSLVVYPIKSATKGLRVKEWEINEHGLKYDRQFAFSRYDEKEGCYVTVTLKECPKLIRLSIDKFDEVNKCFELSYFDVITKQKEIVTIPCEFDDEFVLKYSSRGLTEKPFLLWATVFDCYVLDKFLTPGFLETFDMPKDTVLLCSKNGKPCTCGSPEKIKKRRRTFFQDYYPLMICSIESFNKIKEMHPKTCLTDLT
ncbi:unnamed protein product [Ambrosiozyma monospora]|uniref:Unnamed protein product n=1 Tax=Ambrosiozyma monospora TaxID=43982 RepID=A0A9W7DDT0_AMBMO|nr:unnamed protein product [Ambrosiozyma monospora]